MPKYLIYTPANFPEVFNAVKSLGDATGMLPSFVALSCEADIDEVTDRVRTVSGPGESLVVEVVNAHYSGPGQLSQLGAFLR